MEATFTAACRSAVFGVIFISLIPRKLKFGLEFQRCSGYEIEIPGIRSVIDGFHRMVPEESGKAEASF
jgi:hypothetical protein